MLDNSYRKLGAVHDDYTHRFTTATYARVPTSSSTPPRASWRGPSVLAFVTSLRHPHDSTDYLRVEVAAPNARPARTAAVAGLPCLRRGQSRPGLCPAGADHLRRSGLPAAGAHARRAVRPGALRPGQGHQDRIGLAAARRVAPDHVMVFDADDFVYRGVTSTCTAGRRRLFRRRGLHLLPGALRLPPGQRLLRPVRYVPCAALAALRGPRRVPVHATQAAVEEAFGERLHALLGAHRGTRAWLAGRGVQPSPAIARRGLPGGHGRETLRHGPARPRPPPWPAAKARFSPFQATSAGLRWSTGAAPREVASEVRRALSRLRRRPPSQTAEE